ncbi:MAG TPA: PGPGW domain-containing protein [Acidimicrobiia bacterium]|jgi:uncharacterized protein (TIGR02611 family)|nr:PGPGW domain-containing protein [Acidimicrobiia bacterium]
MVRIARIGAGTGLVLLGLILLVLPGPGILTMAAGLAVLATEFEWARNLLDWMKARYRSYFTNEKDVPDEVRDVPVEP